MYKDEEKLDKFKTVCLTEECHQLVFKEKERLKREDKRKVSLMKIINNLIIEKYGCRFD